jgi:pSer/pThr/pTyr-binding forkhead associated (FHA) protein
MAKLVFLDASFAGHVYELVVEKTTVGRGPGNTLVVRHPSLSAAHCVILMNGSEIIVRDLDSRNGTFVDGARLNKQSQVKSGQTIRFGSVDARLDLGPEPEATTSTEETAVYSHLRALRDQRRAEKQPQPVASMQLGDVPGLSTEEQTVLVPRTERGQPPSALTGANPAPSPGSADSKVRLAVAAAIIAVLALSALVWLLSRT